MTEKKLLVKTSSIAGSDIMNSMTASAALEETGTAVGSDEETASDEFPLSVDPDEMRSEIFSTMSTIFGIYATGAPSKRSRQSI